MSEIRRIAIWNPNLSRASGGAEIYLLNLARILKEDRDVIILTAEGNNAEETVRTALFRYGMPSFDIRYVEDPAITDRTKFTQQLLFRETIQHEEIERWIREQKTDLFINGTFGNLCGFEGVKNWHVVHFPQKPAADEGFAAHIREYLESYDRFLCNSAFSAQWFERYYGKKAEVLYPLVDIERISESEYAKKENRIMTCGRISPAKKMAEMIHAFRILCQMGIRDYRFVVAGLCDQKDSEYLDHLRKEAEHLPVEIHTDLSRQELIETYRTSRFYWHAMGLGVAEDNPLKMEHFGMTTVEAMASGCVPIVIDKGGQREIVEKESGLRFSDTEELAAFTADLIRDPERTERLAKNAVLSAQRYLPDHFRKEIQALLASAE